MGRPKPYKGAKPAESRDDPDLDPYEIEFRDSPGGERGPREPFVNEHGVVIGDHDYASASSPLEHWSEDTDPAVMAGEQWVHPYKDIGFLTNDNRGWFERGIPPSRPFMHPTHSTAAGIESGEETDYPVPEDLDEP
ncbi:DUF3905 domain-containing protein [Paenibacillaceae bacterium WGS1546]|uniref:DUF3905 domain-containing protein n=1 Tax=Cohnella sp. WGS1546 TaxID=3366810 RepID=UPI00372CF6FE